jgi:small subunit ribosomal protein S17
VPETPQELVARRKVRQGIVVSAARDKTVTVQIAGQTSHPMYKKTMRRTTKLHVHDESNEAGVGDLVRIIETRPLSKQKRWRLAEIIERAK